MLLRYMLQIVYSTVIVYLTIYIYIYIYIYYFCVNNSELTKGLEGQCFGTNKRLIWQNKYIYQQLKQTKNNLTLLSLHYRAALGQLVVGALHPGNI